MNRDYYLLLLVIGIFILTARPVFADKAYTANKKGIEAYENGDYEESSRYFSDAVVERPESGALKYNLGTALSGQKETEEAIKALASAAASAKNPSVKASALYNAGNLMFNAGELDRAIDVYKQAVKLDQSVEDYRHNLELAVRKKQQQQQQQQQRPEKEKKDDQQNKGEDQKEEDTTEDENQDKNRDDEQEEKDERSQTENSEEDERQDSQEQPSNQEMNENTPMTPEEAKRILDALSDEERRTMSLRKQQMKREMRQGDDW